MGCKEGRTGSESSATDWKCSDHRSRGTAARHQGPLDRGRVTVVATQPSLKYLLRAPSLAISDRSAGALRRGDRSQHCGVDHRPTAIRVEVQQALWRRWFGSRVPEGAERLHRRPRNAAQLGGAVRVGRVCVEPKRDSPGLWLFAEGARGHGHRRSRCTPTARCCPEVR
jgi:hypothetical protein